MGAEVCAKTCFKRYVPKRLLGTLDPGTGRDGNAGGQRQLATVFVAEFDCQNFKGNLQWQHLAIANRLSTAMANGNA